MNQTIPRAGGVQYSLEVATRKFQRIAVGDVSDELNSKRGNGHVWPARPLNMLPASSPTKNGERLASSEYGPKSAHYDSYWYWIIGPAHNADVAGAFSRGLAADVCVASRDAEASPGPVLISGDRARQQP